jgi:hypothetical protein
MDPHRSAGHVVIGFFRDITDDKFEEHGHRSEQNTYLKEGFDRFLNVH